MTSHIKITAHCAPDKELRVEEIGESSGTDICYDDSESAEYSVWDNKYVLIYEQDRANPRNFIVMERDIQSSILSEIKEERVYQLNKWGEESDLKINRPSDFISYIAKYSTKWYDGTFFPFRTSTVDAFRTCMIKVAAIAVAAVESLDKQRAEDGKAFYEEVEQ